MFSKKDIGQIEAHGLTLEAIERQLEGFRRGFPFLAIVSAASVGDGIIRMDDRGREEYAERFRKYTADHKVLKFVPASGAATRMFKDLFEFIITGNSNKVTNDVLARSDEFAFYEELEEYLPEDASAEEIIAAIISGKGLNYGYQPKALILFHKYADGPRTALEEHLVEGAQYAACSAKVNLHFTVSPEHREGFERVLCTAMPIFSSKFKVEYEVSMSEQESSTDTIAVNPNNTPFRNEDGSLLFRPAGHGALLQNLNAVDADLVFIKNIDNVTTDSRRYGTVEYKQALAGLLVELQEKSFAYISMLKSGDDPSEGLLDEVRGFVNEKLCVRFCDDYYDGNGSRTGKGKRDLLLGILDRPIRVCGMVLNEGEPGGGPFWTKNSDGTVSLQIAEPSQVAPDQQDILSGGTHFNPVDLVCGLRRYDGSKFDLSEYVDPATGFVSAKSKDGKQLLAQELPGLWNGAMSKWNTVFVEVPVSTFTPVKVVTDLLRPEHQE